jgi:acyl-CoA synthetase (AMP-forming)/AMP-acid ligase II/acyl carrier protein/NRPS condensation-like uncharacterized protein
LLSLAMQRNNQSHPNRQEQGPLAGIDSLRKPARKVGTFASLAELIAYHARTMPDREAILAPGRVPMDYRTLWSCATQTLAALRSAGIGRTDRVAVVLPDGPEAAAAIVSVAAASVCVPLNPSFTADEWRRYFNETRAAVLLTSPATASPSRAVARAHGIPVIDISPPPSRSAACFRITNVPNKHASGDNFASGHDDALILLTSGTISRPKTIPLTHGAVCQSAANVGAAIELTPQDRLLSVLPLFHGHGLISGVIAALCAGSSVICTPGFDATAFFDWLIEFRPTWYTAVPTIHRAILETAEKHQKSVRQSSLRLIRSASSTLPAKVLRGLEALFKVPVIDTFGMTEAATQIAANPLHRRKSGSVGIAAGAEIAILDDAGRQLAAGERGEIALRGPTITRGYDNDPASTREAFRDGWFRTGDLGYLDQDGYLFIVGRIKEVINRGGQKVAPGEVEEVLLSHPDVVEAAVFSRPHPRLGADVAAAIVLRHDAKVGTQELRSFVRKRLSSFKVPSLIRIVPDIPRGAGGKIKRAELAAAFALTQPAARRHGAPRSELQREIAKIWADLLELEQIGVEQDVFALGVDSIIITQMILRLHERFGVDLSFDDLLAAPTIAALAMRVQRSTKHAGAALSAVQEPKLDDAGAITVRHPVAIVQERMLRIEREVPGLPQFNLPFAYRLRGVLNVTALKRSLAEVVRRHDSLRTSFTWRDGQPVAAVIPPIEARISFRVHDLAESIPVANLQAKALLRRKARLAAEQESLKAFDMSCAPLFRARLLRLGTNDHVLLLVIHDIVIDGWSMGVLMQEVAELYGAFTGGTPAQLPKPLLRFSDFVRWQQEWCGSEAANRQFVYWRKRLRTASPLFASGNLGDGLAARLAHERLRIPHNVLARLNDLSRSRDATLFVTLLAGFKTLLLLRTGRNDICVATAMANRARSGTERVIGPFATTAIIRSQIDADLSFHEAINRVRQSVLEAYAHQELPFDVLAEQLSEAVGMNPESLIQAYFVLQIAFRRPIKFPGVTVRPFGYREGQSVMPLNRTCLTMTLSETPSGMIGACTVRRELCGARRWVDDYLTILGKAAENPKRRIDRIAEELLMGRVSRNQ